MIRIQQRLERLEKLARELKSSIKGFKSEVDGYAKQIRRRDRKITRLQTELSDCHEARRLAIRNQHKEKRRREFEALCASYSKEVFPEQIDQSKPLLDQSIETILPLREKLSSRQKALHIRLLSALARIPDEFEKRYPTVREVLESNVPRPDSTLENALLGRSLFGVASLAMLFASLRHYGINPLMMARK